MTGAKLTGARVIGSQTTCYQAQALGVPASQCTKAMADAKLSGVDLWIGAGGAPVASLTVPVLHPKVFVPNHLGNFFLPFEQGLTAAFGDPTLSTYLTQHGISLVAPVQYLDAYVRDATGFRAVDNAAMKARYAF